MGTSWLRWEAPLTPAAVGRQSKGAVSEREKAKLWGPRGW